MEESKGTESGREDRPKQGSSHLDGHPAGSSAKASGKGKKAAVPRGPKRRTKTGCLTCRKRRIKCGEEKPRCNNCIKAKRECEGYTQRVIFKHALGPFGGGAFQSSAPLLPQQPQHHHHQYQYQPGQPHPHRLLAPRIPQASSTSLLPAHAVQLLRHGPQLSYHSQPHESQSSPALISSADDRGIRFQSESGEGQTASHLPPETGFQPHYYPFSTHDAAQEILGDGEFPAHPVEGSQSDELASYTFQVIEQCTSQTEHPTDEVPLQDGVSSWDARVEAAGTSIAPQTSSQMVYYEEEDNEYYDVDSDDDMQEATEEEGFNQMSLIIASAGQSGIAVRSYNTFLNEPNILASYRPSMGSSPLNNPKTARIWVHFVHATGPSLSIWERHTTNSAALFAGPVPPSQQGLWSYTMPLKSLEHPALLQGILAISSLHIAKLQKTHLTIAYKHYQYALRKVSKAVGLSQRRKQAATLAATLLLCFYEVIAAEHTKWDSHIAGAAQLLKEIDFPRLTRDLRAQRRSVRQQRMEWSQYNSFPSYQYVDNYAEEDPFAEKESEIDMTVLSMITGKAVDYDIMGYIENEGSLPSTRTKHFSRKDIETFRIQCDLYWWYCKHDLTQSMISGNKFYTPYDRWTQCPPRAALGRADAVYGSFDHLILLKGRMVDFGYRDRKRKIKSLEATRGEWSPHPGFFQFMGRFASKPSAGGPMNKPHPTAPSEGNTSAPHKGGSPSQPSSKGSSPSTNPPSSGPRQQPMYGMAPTRGPGVAPAAFTSSAESTPYSKMPEDESNLTLLEAEKEWEEILAAYDFYESQLGDAFAPLPAGSAPPISTPFGPALQYRSYLIAVLWAFYYTGRLMHFRLHPCMPPATMKSAVTAAGTTAQYAQIIGKIVSGIYYPQLYNLDAGSLNPALGAALVQITVPIFFAGVQYTDAAQRGWTVATLRNISRLTGWQSADAIADGCESAWYITAKTGKGPPYTSASLSNREGIVVDERSNRGQHVDAQSIPTPSNDRRFVTVAAPRRSLWAMGILSLESDLVDLKLENPS
ncbi:hypothetical protein PISL3812_03877 [Talaromyces islandicus]|uniref:Zn(2)-C6 fungal-type domain-containing protein n=1 Tax=Talaromyces islandicus TaxID=28573 RepID=A0A0U1LUG5_TALIS|nr:hypothetical protein PISL3812_03877 [Talaromyces islandicus]